MNKKVFILFLILTLAGCAQINSRLSDNSKKETRLKTAKSRIIAQIRGEVLENWFNVYDPSFLALVWPKLTNGVHLFVEPVCWEDATVLFKDLADGKAWAYSVVDASGRYQSGLFNGNRFWLGSKEQCLRLDNDFITSQGNASYADIQNGEFIDAVLRREKYYDGGTDEWRSPAQRDELLHRLVVAANTPAHRLAYTAAQLTLNLTKITMAQSFDITLGVCLPRSCSPDDVASILHFSIMLNDNLKFNKTIPRNVKVTSLRRVEEYYDVTEDTGAIVLICVTVLLFVLCVIATLVDYKLIKCRPHNSKSMSFNLPKYNNSNIELENKGLDDIKHNCDMGLETLTINNINNSHNINLVTVKKVIKPNAMPPSITLDVVSMEGVTGSCKRCGKYKKQCNANNSKQLENLSACPRVKSFASFTENKRKHNFFKTILLCFSLNHSWKRIFNTNMANKDLAFIHLLRIVATFWIMFVHVAVVSSYVSENGGDINEHNNVYYIIVTGSLAFDTLFFVSGMFSSHHFFLLKSQYTVEELVSFGGICGQILQFICFITNRAIRLVPSYAYAIFLSGVVARAARRTAALALPDHDDVTCDAHWWRNLLYVTTLFPKDEQCMQISWYMSAETQLHVAGALACALAGAAARAAAGLAAAALLAAAAADLGAAHARGAQHLSSAFDAYAVFIERPMARVAPYFIGVFAGWLVHRMDGELNISKRRACALWVWSGAALAGALGAARLTAGAGAALRALWPLALLWPAVASATQFRSAGRGWARGAGAAALSRLGGAALLLHGAALRHALPGPVCATTACIGAQWAGAAARAAAGALALALLLDTPACSLLRRLSDYAA